MSAPVATLFAQEEFLEGPSVSPGFLHSAQVRLFNSPFLPSRDSTLAELEAIEADYPGYASATAGTWGDASVMLDGSVTITAPSIQFQPTGSDSQNTIYGWFMTDQAGTNLIAVEAFDAPVPLPSEDYAVIVIPRVAWGS